MSKGTVYLVGAGPGRADLLTLRGAELLKKADCIICDKLANPQLLKFAKADAEIIHTPKRIGPGSFTQEQINQLMVEKASAGRTVVRLKGGDPYIFGRAAEEAKLLADAGIDFEVVPGITAATAAAEYAGLMLTDRNLSSQVVFVTGREAEDKKDTNIDWHLLAKFSGTIVFYMGVENLRFITDKLLENGMDKDMPVAVVADATLPSQRIVRANLASIADKCKEQKIEPPAVVIIGKTAKGDRALDWLSKKPLFGKTIVVTRDNTGNAEFAAKIIVRSGSPIEFETIKLKPLTSSSDFLRALEKINEFNWVIFTSGNGVRFFFDYLRQLNKDARVFASAKIAAIGTQTAEKLRSFGIISDFVPTIFTSRELGKQIIRFTNLQKKSILLIRSQQASNELPELLEQAGAKVDNIAVYTIETEQTDSALLLEKIKTGKVDWVTFTSPSSAKGFFEQLPPNILNSSDVKVASIGPVTSEQLSRLGVNIDAEAKEHTIDGLLDAMERSDG